jgi:hypothetical protein
MTSEVLYFFPADKNVKNLLIAEVGHLDGYVVTESNYDFSTFGGPDGLTEEILMTAAKYVVAMFEDCLRMTGNTPALITAQMRREHSRKVIFEGLKKIATVGEMGKQ